MIHVFVLIITETTIVIKKSYQNPNDKTKYRTDNYGGNTKELLYAEYPKYQPKEKGTDSAIYKNGHLREQQFRRLPRAQHGADKKPID